MVLVSRLAPAVVLVLLTAPAVRADIPVPGETPEQAAARRARQNQIRFGILPPPPPPTAVPLMLKGTGYLPGGQPRLVLPRKVLENLQASLNPGASGPLGLDLRTAVAGIALSVAAVWVGLLLARSRRRLALASVGVLLVGFVVVGTGCPPRDQPITREDYRLAPLARTPDGKLAGTVLVEVADADGVVLQAQRETLSQFIVDAGLKAEFAP
ncbi:MAG TPA: hypothetical protein VEL76_17005 [Gemmataceae bacterium]|nr:hypothetical protein [Gemmataceae bacterium]